MDEYQDSEFSPRANFNKYFKRQQYFYGWRCESKAFTNLGQARPELFLEKI